MGVWQEKSVRRRRMRAELVGHVSVVPEGPVGYGRGEMDIVKGGGICVTCVDIW